MNQKNEILDSKATFFLPLWIIAVILLVFLIKSASSVLNPLLFGSFIAIVVYPLVRLLHERLRFNYVLSVLITMILVFFVILIGLSFLQQSLFAFTKDLPSYYRLLEERINHMMPMIQESGFWLVLDDFIPEDYSFSQTISDSLGTVSRFLSNFALGTLSSVRSLVSGALLVFLVAIFVLLEAKDMSKRMLQVFGHRALSQSQSILKALNAYLKIKLITSLITGLIITLGFQLFGIKHVFFLGFIAFLLNFIPTIGSIVAAFPGLLLVLIQFGFGLEFSFALGIYLLVNILIGSLIEPRIIGYRVGVSPLFIFLALVFFGWLLGILGMFLAVPLLMLLKSIFESNDQMKKLGSFITDSKVLFSRHKPQRKRNRRSNRSHKQKYQADEKNSQPVAVLPTSLNQTEDF